MERLEHVGDEAAIDEDIEDFGLVAYLGTLAGPTQQELRACAPSWSEPRSESRSGSM